MTTKVTVDAHAGWPVKVTSIAYDSTGETSRSDSVVPAHTHADFYIHSNMRIAVEEMPREGPTKQTIAQADVGKVEDVLK